MCYMYVYVNLSVCVYVTYRARIFMCRAWFDSKKPDASLALLHVG